jgi:hypothetical protein
VIQDSDISLSIHMLDGDFGMENMSIDDLSLLLGVTEIWMVPNILVLGL